MLTRISLPFLLGAALLALPESACGQRRLVVLSSENAMDRLDDDPVRMLQIDELVAALKNAISTHDSKKGPFRIAVLPPGNHEGNLTREERDAALAFRGALNARMRDLLASEEGNRNFSLMGDFAIAESLKNQKVDAADIHINNVKLAEVASEMRIDALVLGTVAEGEVTLTLVLAAQKNKGQQIRLPAAVPNPDFDSSNNFLDQERIGASLQVRREVGGRWSDWKDLPVVIDDRKNIAGREPDSRMFAVIDESLLRQTHSYRVVIRNRGMGPEKFGAFLGCGNPSPDLEKKRIFAAAVLIDGVNSFFENVGEGPEKRAPIAVHPRDAVKWLVGPPGYRISVNGNEPPLLTPAGLDHSAVAVEGFQDGDKLGRAFEFRKARVGDDAGTNDEAIPAAQLGLTHSLGLISVFVFAQKLSDDQSLEIITRPGDLAGPGDLGTAAGRPFANPVVQVKVDLYRQPVAQFHFHYRLEKDIPIPREHWVAVCGTRLPGK